jgi:tyrosine-protein phosphatase SIW14
VHKKDFMNRALKSVFLLSSLSIISNASITQLHADESIPIHNFYEVSDGIYRGAAPGSAGMAYLKSIDIRSDLDLQSSEFVEIHEEKQISARDGIDFFAEPLLTLPGVTSILQPQLNEKEMDTIMQIVSDTSLRPLFVHCTHGEDRTGLVIGLYRVLNENWAPADAWAEMLKYGYHPTYEALTRYFSEKTGWNPPKTSN